MASDDLVIHCAVMGRPGDETNRLIKYLIEACPSSLEAKSDTGYTPLYLACLLGRVQFAKTLIDAGADQAVRDVEYNNLVRIISRCYFVLLLVWLLHLRFPLLLDDRVAAKPAPLHDPYAEVMANH